MSKPNDGGTIFPRFLRSGDNEISEGGMTLRDYFAGQALQSVTAAFIQIGALRSSEDHKDTVFLAYQLADAMLAQRSRADLPPLPERDDDVCPECGGVLDENGDCDFIRTNREAHS